jgi:spermidine synthase
MTIVATPIAGTQRLPLMLSVGLIAGAVIALQIAIMRVFAVGSWAHFGSMVVSLAMLGFGLASVVLCIGRDWFDRHWRGAAAVSVFLFGPLTVAANLAAQQLPFNPIFIVSDPSQKWRLAANFLLYLVPFLSGAFFLGIVFLKAREAFGRVYFADLTGSGLAGLLILAAMYVFPPEELIAVPLLLWTLGGALWLAATDAWKSAWALVGVAALSLAGYAALPTLLGVPQIAVSQYKGVAYARNFPDAARVYRSVSPFGDLQVYQSSYMHFAPGLSDNAAFNLPEEPANTYVGLYVDGEGPEGVMRRSVADATDYFRYLPMIYPYLVKEKPKTFVVQFGGGISTMVALRSGSQSVTVAESNPEVLKAFRSEPLRSFAGNILADPRVRVIGYDGRLYLAHTDERYDVIDLSLADSVGLSNPGGFAIVEKYPYTREAMLSYMDALADGGVLSVTLWNREEPPKSILKLYATMADAARSFDPDHFADSLFAVSSYLATTTILYKKGGFTAHEVAKLRQQTKSLSFDEVYSPGFAFDPADAGTVVDDYRASIFGNGSAQPAAGGVDPTGADPTGPDPGAVDPTGGDDGGSDTPQVLPSTLLQRLAWHGLVHGGWPEIAEKYVFDTRELTNDRPYFAAYVRPGDLPKTLDRLDIFQDEWGYLLVWATLIVACIAAASLVLIPMVQGWRLVFSDYRGKAGTILYFACLGLGYIMVEVGLISRFTLALANPTISAAVLIAGMLVFSGLGSLAAGRIFLRARAALPLIFVVIAALLFVYGRLLDPVLDWIGTFPYALRLVLCFLLIAPPSFLMGFPMATAMGWLARLNKDRMFVWAWGINGCFSVIGAAAVPIVAASFGLAAVLETSAIAYLVAIPAFFAVLLPPRPMRERVLA